MAVVRIAAGHRRTGLCPTFAQPTLQRDGFLVRVPLVGGLLLAGQLERLAAVAGQSANGIIELTNRGNLQIRGFAPGVVGNVLDACRAVGLGDYSASLVTISPLAGPAEYRARDTLVRLTADLDVGRLSRKFAFHVDDGDRNTADRPADMLVWLAGDGGYVVAVRGLGATTCASAPQLAGLGQRLAERCIQHGPLTRPADLVATEGAAALAAALPATGPWLSAPSCGPARPLDVGTTMLASGEQLAVLGAKFGRLTATNLAGIGRLLRRHGLVSLRVTPWRALAIACSSPAQAAAVLADSAGLGLLVDSRDPALGIIACIGSTGCWQTQLDTLAEAERCATGRPAAVQPGGLVHVSGCDKFCATRAPVALTRLGRADQTGFDTVS